MEATREALGLGVDFTKVDRFEEGGGEVASMLYELMSLEVSLA